MGYCIRSWIKGNFFQGGLKVKWDQWNKEITRLAWKNVTFVRKEVVHTLARRLAENAISLELLGASHTRIPVVVKKQCS